jgi:hypothetical protein
MEVELHTVQQGTTTMSVVGSEASRRLCKALEDCDPWGSIPLVHSRSCSLSEALEAIQANGVYNTLKLAKLEAV